MCAHVCSEFNLEYIRYRKWLEIKSITVFIEEHGTILFFPSIMYFSTCLNYFLIQKLYGRCNTLIVYNLLTSGKTLFIGIFISCVFQKHLNMWTAVPFVVPRSHVYRWCYFSKICSIFYVLRPLSKLFMICVMNTFYCSAIIDPKWIAISLM